MFKAPFLFKGRIRRIEFCLSLVIYFASFLIISIICYEVFGWNDSINGFIFFIFFITTLWSFFAQSTKRCHDIGENGWCQLIPFYIFELCFKKGQLGDNKYGTDPKEKKNKDATINAFSNGKIVTQPLKSENEPTQSVSDEIVEKKIQQVLCNSCKVIVPYTTDKICVLCGAENWGYK